MGGARPAPDADRAGVRRAVGRAGHAGGGGGAGPPRPGAAGAAGGGVGRGQDPPAGRAGQPDRRQRLGAARPGGGRPGAPAVPDAGGRGPAADPGGRPRSRRAPRPSASGIGDQADAACAALPELAPVLEPRDPEKLGPEDFGEARSVHALAGLLDALGNAGQPGAGHPGRRAVGRRGHVQAAAPLAGPAAAGAGQGPHRAGGLASAARRSAPDHPLRHIEGAARVSLAPLEAADIRQLAESMAGALPEEALAVVEELRRRQPVHGRGGAARDGRERGAAAGDRSPGRW